MLKISIPNKCVSEQRYILNVMLSDFLGLDFEVSVYDGDYVLISIEGSHITLRVDASFFNLADDYWLQSSSIPELPLRTWNTVSDGIKIPQIKKDVPILFGAPGLVKAATCWHLNVDIFGGAFFMLSRYEELTSAELDEHNRFPAYASIASKSGFLDRPLVNEYLEILWSCIQELWGSDYCLVRKQRKFRKMVSCDVDHPIDHAGYYLGRTIRRVIARLIRDKNPYLAMLDFLNYLFKKLGSDRFDSCLNNVYWMMRVNKKVGNIVAFYFIPVQTNTLYEDDNSILSPQIRGLIDDIVRSGHEVGIHPGYDTYNNEDRFNDSVSTFKSLFDNSLKFSQGKIGGRQHYLRYDIGVTPKLWEANGFSYDSSLGYADRSGFRAGSCYEYVMYDLIGRRPLKLKQRPLIAMDCSVISKGYEGLEVTDLAKNRFKQLENICKEYQGDFTLLWHNSFFSDGKSKKLYLELLGV